jgi:hypothetical protein
MGRSMPYYYGLFCASGRFVPWVVLCHWSFWAVGCFLCRGSFWVWAVLSLGRFEPWAVFSLGRFELGPFHDGPFWAWDVSRWAVLYVPLKNTLDCRPIWHVRWDDIKSQARYSTSHPYSLIVALVTPSHLLICLYYSRWMCILDRTQGNMSSLKKTSQMNTICTQFERNLSACLYLFIRFCPRGVTVLKVCFFTSLIIHVRCVAQ